MEKKTWEKPELIVIVRSKPEEAVLNACKGHSHPGRNFANGCNTKTDPECTDITIT